MNLYWCGRYNTALTFISPSIEIYPITCLCLFWPYWLLEKTPNRAAQ